MPRERFETAVHLIETDGGVFSGAEAAFCTLGHSTEGSLLLGWYQRSPTFARITERGYSFIARHRRLFSFLTRIAWGQNLEPPSHLLVRWAFLRSLGLIYLVAFLSLWVQLIGLIGNSGILPATLIMLGYREEAKAAHLGVTRYRVLPTLCWFSASDGFLKAQCVAGTVLSLLLILGIAPAPCLFLLWLIYLSLAVVSREFLSFQWDNLLLETGFLAIFFAPLQWLPRRLSCEVPPSKAVLWLLRWLLFRLMFSSGLVKLLSGDPTWRNLTALKFHYETQPLPTWIGWYAHQLPGRMQQFTTAIMFVIELLLPFLILTPRRLRLIPFFGFALLQVAIFLTGNYCFFNLLSILLCLPLLDDAMLRKWIPYDRLRPLFIRSQPSTAPASTNPDSDKPIPAKTQIAGRFRSRWPIQVIFPLTCIAILIPLMEFTFVLRVRPSWPGPLKSLFTWVAPFRTFNHYGLFMVMTTNRQEIVIQGSNDGNTWLDYEFKYKPGDVKHRPSFVEPHQPRLDWQMWFAALSNYQHNLWFLELCVRLFNNSPDVVGLLRTNPFPKAPPRYLRAVVYEYHFTDFATRRRTGAWWRRELKGEYLPVISAQRRGK